MEISLSCLLASMAQIKKALALLLFLLSHFSPRDVYHGQKRPEHVSSNETFFRTGQQMTQLCQCA